MDNIYPDAWLQGIHTNFKIHVSRADHQQLQNLNPINMWAGKAERSSEV